MCDTRYSVRMSNSDAVYRRCLSCIHSPQQTAESTKKVMAALNPFFTSQYFLIRSVYYYVGYTN
jgi:hypothetical protein